MYQFPRCDNSAQILATARVLAESRLTCSVWSDEWIRILCNDYFLATVIGYTDYFEVIVTLYQGLKWGGMRRYGIPSSQSLSYGHTVYERREERLGNVPFCIYLEV